MRDDDDGQWQNYQNEYEQYEHEHNRSNAMKLDDLVPSSSKYLAKADVGEEGRVLTIAGFQRTEIDGEKKMCLVWAEEDVKPMVLNKVNTQRLKVATGEDTTEGVKGKKVLVFEDPMVEFSGKVVGGLRLGKAKSVATESAVSADAIDDEIPF
jgi:hypothetical protein